jgi:hypothetical protein
VTCSTCPFVLLPGVLLQIKFTKSKSDFYVLISQIESGAFFEFLDATQHVIHMKPSPTIQLAHTKALEKVKARYDMNSVALETFTYGAGCKWMSIDNVVLGTVPKHPLFAMLLNADFTGSADTNPHFFRHFGFNHFVNTSTGGGCPPTAWLQTRPVHRLARWPIRLSSSNSV